MSTVSDGAGGATVLGELGPLRATRPPGARPGPVRLVVAAVRPTRPNADVVTTAAQAAQDHHAQLLVFGTVRVVPVDYSQAALLPALLTEDFRVELFADVVELLYDRELTWSVQVATGHPARRLNHLARSCELHTVVTGRTSRRREWWRTIGDQTCVVVTE